MSISLPELIKDFQDREVDTEEDSLLVKLTAELPAGEQPKVTVGEHEYLLGKIHPKTGKIFEAHQMKRVSGRLNTAQDITSHITDHSMNTKPKGLDLIDALDEWMTDEGEDVSLWVVSYIVFSIIARVPID